MHFWEQQTHPKLKSKRQFCRLFLKKKKKNLNDNIENLGEVSEHARLLAGTMRHYKKTVLRPRFQNAAIGHKNACMVTRGDDASQRLFRWVIVIYFVVLQY